MTKKKQVQRAEEYMQALNELIEFGVRGEMVGYARLTSGSYIFLTTQRHQEPEGVLAFGVTKNVVTPGLWMPLVDEKKVRILWGGEKAMDYEVEGFRMNMLCIPTPEMTRGSSE